MGLTPHARREKWIDRMTFPLPRSRLLVLAGFAVILTAGLVHGLWTDRWTSPRAIEEACARLRGCTPALAGWTFEDQEMADTAIAKAEVTGYRRWRCVRQSDGQVLTVLLLCGRFGPLSVHTPDVCYGGVGYQVAGKIARTTFTVPGL